MSPLSVPNFSPIGAYIGILRRILQSVQNEKENQNLATHISEKCLEHFLQNCM